MLQLFSTREIASIIWIIVYLLLCLVSKKRRSFARALVEFYLKPKMLPRALFFLVCTVIISYFFSLSPLWNWKYTKDISLWFVFTGLALYRSTLDFDLKQHYYKSLLRDSIRFTAFAEFIISSFTFSLVTEIIVFPILLIVMILNTPLKKSPQTASEANTSRLLQTIIGLVILFFTLIVAISEFQSLKGVDMLISFSLPLILTILFIPITYIITLHTEYRKLFCLIEFRDSYDKDFKQWYQNLSFHACGFSLVKVSLFKKYFAVNMSKSITKDEFVNLVYEFRSNYKDLLDDRHLSY